ncbi:hypothetical protein FRC04_010219 [Tulasnella sp. 424]|nr:hypothetical protein FRC04_010219 [Tulasnella sp. 424]
MDNFNDFLGQESPYSYNDNRIRDPIVGLTLTFDPLRTFLPDPLLTEITTPSPPSESTNTVSPVLTEEEEAHVDSLLLFGINSPLLPPSLLTPPVAAAETPPALASVVPEAPSAEPTETSVSPMLVGSALCSPTTAYAAASVSPPALKRLFSLFTVDEPDEPQEPTPGPSDPPPLKRPCTSLPGESFFQLDPTVEPLESTKPAGPPLGKPPRTTRTDYSACRCLGGRTSKPARHWRACPYNPNAGKKRFTCELCGTRFTREDNKFRHLEDYH